MLQTDQWPHQLVQDPEVNQRGVEETIYVAQKVTVKNDSDNYGKYALQFHEDPTSRYWQLKPDFDDNSRPLPYSGPKYPAGTTLNVWLVTNPWESKGKSGINYNIRKIR